MECFKDCVRATSTYSGNGGEPEDSEVNSHIIGAKVTEAVDELQPEFLKALDDSGPSWPQNCMEIGDRGVCSNCKGIRVLSLCGRFYVKVGLSGTSVLNWIQNVSLVSLILFWRHRPPMDIVCCFVWKSNILKTEHNRRQPCCNSATFNFYHIAVFISTSDSFFLFCV